MHDLSLLINITLALVVAFIGGTLARRIGLPTIVGYLLSGIVISPFTPGVVGDVETIQQLAELGVIFLMFGVGLHFSFQDLWRVRQVALPGALLQTLLSSLAGFGLTRLWGWPVSSGIVLGLAISVASTVVLLRGLMDHGLLNTEQGQAAVGWLVMEDLISVIILVLMPALVPSEAGFDWASLGLTLVKTLAFVLIMYFGGYRLIPWVLERIAHLRSRELFILAILAITLGTAMAASEWFGVSLALGAFVAGAIISQSYLSHQVGADIFSFREAFSALFFVSVGMLVNPAFLWQNIGQVSALTFLVVMGKLAIVVLMGLLFPQRMRTFFVVAVGLSQIGEFSFVLGQGGLALNLLDSNQYSLLLAAALISITLNPFMYRLLPLLEMLIERIPALSKQNIRPIQASFDEQALRDHVVIVDYGRVGKHLVEVLRSLSISFLVIETDVERMEALQDQKIAALYGDAANPEIIEHAHLERARTLVITTPDEEAALRVVEAAHRLHPDLPVIVRASTEEGLDHLAAAGAMHVVHPELEGGLEIVNHTLLELGFPLRQVHEYAEAVRRDRYASTLNSEAEHRSLRDLLSASGSVEITWMELKDRSPLVGQTLREADLRSHTGASVVALMRQRQLTVNPKSSTLFQAGDRLGLIGDREHIEAARNLLSASPDSQQMSV